MKRLALPGPEGSAEATPKSKIAPTRLWFFSKRFFWVPIVTGLIAATFFSLQLYLSPIMYTSVATLLYKPNVVVIGSPVASRDELQNKFGTEIQLLQSDRIVRRAHNRAMETRPGAQEAAVDLKIAQQRNASVIVLQAFGTDREYVQNFLGFLMDEYIRYKKSSAQKELDPTIETFQVQAAALETEFKAAQEKLHVFEATNDIVVLQKQAENATAFLSKLNSQLSEMGLEDKHLSSLITNLMAVTDFSKSTGTNDIAAFVTAVGTGTDLASARTTLEMLKNQRAKLEETYGPKHARMIKIIDDIARQEKLVALLEEQIKDKIKSNRDALKMKMLSVKAEIKEWEAKVLGFSAKIAEHSRLRTMVERTKSAYEKVEAKLKDLDTAKSLDKENIEPLERASIPVRVQESILRKVVIPSILAIFAGLGIIMLIARIDDRITSLTDLESNFQEPVVGYIPEIKIHKSDGASSALLKPDDERHMFVESFRNLRSALIYLHPEGSLFKTLMISSAVPVEGKSLVSINLAQTLAWSGNKVLLVDGDLRRGHLHDHLKLQASPGFSDLLTAKNGNAPVIQPTSDENLYFLSRGSNVKRPGELLLSERAGKAVAEFGRAFDYVLIDSAPVLATDDTTSLAPRVDGILFVVRCSSTGVRLAQKALALLYQRNAKVLGIVFNRTRAKGRDNYMYKYDEYYSTPQA